MINFLKIGDNLINEKKCSIEARWVEGASVMAQVVHDYTFGHKEARRVHKKEMFAALESIYADTANFHRLIS